MPKRQQIVSRFEFANQKTAGVFLLIGKRAAILILLADGGRTKIQTPPLELLTITRELKVEKMQWF
jgi:hypothetical protein